MGCFFENINDLRLFMYCSFGIGDIKGTDRLKICIAYKGVV